jgi:hypothetical protein
MVLVEVVMEYIQEMEEDEAKMLRAFLSIPMPFCKFDDNGVRDEILND